MLSSTGLTHINAEKNMPCMVDVSDKIVTKRKAHAQVGNICLFHQQHTCVACVMDGHLGSCLSSIWSV